MNKRHLVSFEYGFGPCAIIWVNKLWETTMNPEHRTLRQVTIDNGGEADRIFSMLMGDEVPPRREFIENNAKYANIDA